HPWVPSPPRPARGGFRRLRGPGGARCPAPPAGPPPGGPAGPAPAASRGPPPAAGRQPRAASPGPPVPGPPAPRPPPAVTFRVLRGKGRPGRTIRPGQKSTDREWSKAASEGRARLPALGAPILSIFRTLAGRPGYRGGAKLRLERGRYDDSSGQGYPGHAG